MYKRFLGAYKRVPSPASRLHPFVILIFTVSFVIVSGLAGSFFMFAVLIGLLFVCAAAAKIFPPEFIRVFRPFRFLLLFTLVVQLFLTPEGGWAAPEAVTAVRASFFTLRMAVIIGFSSLFAFVVPPMDIVRIFYVLFQPLRLVRISPTDAALSMLIALRFIPLLFTEAEKIMDSQRLKGVLPDKTEKKSRLKIVRASVSLVIPLFIRTFHYAGQIAVTLQYRRHDSAFLKLSRPSVKDAALAALFIALSVSLVMADRHIGPGVI